MRFDAVGGIDDHQRGIDRGQYAVGVLGKILVTRCVEQVDDAVTVLHLHDRTGDRNTPLLFNLHPVGGCVAAGFSCLDRARDVDRAGVEQQLFRSAVVLPASGWEMMAKVRRRAASPAMAALMFKRRRKVSG